MRTGIGAGLVAIGLVLLWIVVTGRTGNFAAAWAQLKGDPPGGAGIGTGAMGRGFGGAISGAAAPAAPTWGDVFRRLPEAWVVPTVPTP